MKKTNQKLREASAMVLLRDTEQGLEVCMLRRVSSSRFAAGAYVFPGGVVEEQDHDPLWAKFFMTENCRDEDSLGYKIAAIRETFEEAGLLISGQQNTPAISAQHRDDLNQEKISLQDIIKQHQLQLKLDEIIFYDHWITPEGAPIRFDTRFFLALAPQGQAISHDQTETDASCWASPASLISLYEQQEIKLMPVTHVQLKRLAAFDSVAAIMHSAKQQTSIAPVLPILHFDTQNKPCSVSIELAEGRLEYSL